MRISATIPDEIGRAVKSETDNISAFVAEALEEKLRRIRRREAREDLLEMAGSGGVREGAIEDIQSDRRESGRV